VTSFHEEQRFRQRWIWTLLAIAALPVLAVVAIRGPGSLPLIAPFLLLAVGVLVAFARLVVDVDREAITVAFRFLWPKRTIPISEVRNAEVITYRAFLDYGGYGVRLGLRGWAWIVSGDQGVLVERKNGARLMIGSQRPKELVAAIARAKRELEGPSGEAGSR
jgi:hypothetical protein